MPTHLPSLLWTSSHPTRLSAVRCRLVTRVTLRQLFLELLCPTLSRVPLPTSGHPWSRVQNTLSGFAPKQTKESSAWRTTYIVLPPHHWHLCHPCIALDLAFQFKHTCLDPDLGPCPARLISPTLHCGPMISIDQQG